MNIAPERQFDGEHPASAAPLPLIVEFTSSRVRQRPIAARAGGIELPYVGRLPVRAVDIDARPDLRRRFRITLLPTFIVMQGAAELARLVGPYSRRELAGALRHVLDPSAVLAVAPPAPRAFWNDFTTRLWGFTVG